MGEALLGCALGGLALALQAGAPAPEVVSAPALATLTAPPEPRADGCRLRVHVHGERPGRAWLAAEPGAACTLWPGATLAGRFTLRSFEPPRNPGAFDRRRFAALRGVRRHGRLQPGYWVEVQPAPSGPGLALEALRRAARRALAAGEAGGSRGRRLLRALLLADRSGLDAELRASFAGAGTAHLLAVSGLHVGQVLWVTHFCVYAALRRSRSGWWLRRSPALAAALATSAALGYAALTGPGVPALRAAAMAGAATIALVAGRRGAPVNALAFAALIVLAREPAALFAPASWLSFAAVCGLILWRPPLPSPARPWSSRAAGIVHAGLAAGLATAPLAALLGLPLPSASVLANAWAVPWFGALVVPAGLLGLGLAVAWPGAGSVFLAPAAWLAEQGIRGVEASASPDLLAGPAPLASAALLAGAGYALRFWRLGERRSAGLVALAAGACALADVGGSWLRSTPPPGALRVDVLDVGHGDAIVVRGGARAWLIDAGPSFGEYDAGRRVVVPALRALGVRRLDALIVTHSDRDHVGGAAALLRHVPVSELWLGAATLAHPGAAALRRVARERGVPLRVLFAGDRPAREPPISVLWPPAGARLGRANDRSLVLRIGRTPGCFVASGDAPRAVERTLAARVGPCALLKLGHHGSPTATDPRWLAAVAPVSAIVSSGRRSRGTWPDPAVLERLFARDVPVWVTRDAGALAIDVHGDGRVRVTPFKTGARPRTARPRAESARFAPCRNDRPR